MQAVHSATATVRQDSEAHPGLQRIGGGAGILGGVAILIVAAVLIPLTAAHGLKGSLEGKEALFYDFLRATLPVVQPLFLLQAAGVVVTLLFVRALDERLRPVAPAASPIAALYGYVAAATLTLAVVASVVMGQTIALGASKESALPTVTAAFAINGTAALAGTFFHAVWLATVSWIAVRRGGLPRSLAYYGFLVAAVGLVTGFLGIKGIGPLSSSIWYIGVGLVMWMRPQLAEPRRAATA